MKSLAQNLPFRIFLVAAAFLLVASHRPDALLNPQFWAEDGKFFYAIAYNKGWRYLLDPLTGYYQTLPKLVALSSLALALKYAPIFYNVIALGIKTSIAVFLASSRLKNLVPNNRDRLALALVFIAFPSIEIHGNITNGHSYLALLAFMAFLFPGESRLAKAFDMLVVLLSGLSGPFVVFIFPAALFITWKNRDRHRKVLLALYLIGGLAQGISILNSLVLNPTPERHTAKLGANVSLFFQILSRNIFLNAVMGKFGLEFLDSFADTKLRGGVYLLAIIIGIMVLILVTCKGPFALKAFTLVSFLIFAAALIKPQVSLNQEQWPLLKTQYYSRYWFFPCLSFLACMIWAVFRPIVPQWIKYSFVCLISLCFAGSWFNEPFTDLDFDRYATEFESIPPGSFYMIPINPPGWKMFLGKK